MIRDFRMIDDLDLPVSFQEGFPASTEAERHTTFYSLPSSVERTPTKMTTSQKVTFCSHGNSAFQPIASSCKIVPQSQVPNPESPGKSFQPITMSCKIVSGIHCICPVSVCNSCQNGKTEYYGFFFFLLGRVFV